MAYDFERIRVTTAAGVATAVLSDPPMNVMTVGLFQDLLGLSEEIDADPDVRVIVFKSADPDFFIAHFDVANIVSRPMDTPARPLTQPKLYHQMCERFRLMHTVSIAQIEGRIGGGGSEFAASLDMRFGVIGKTFINQMEVALGILPGGTGTQRLPRLMGRGRALEVILGCDDLDAVTAADWGYLNRALPADQIGPFVDRLAKRIAAFPPEAVGLAKQSVNAAEKPLADGLLDEALLFDLLLRTPDAKKHMTRFIEMGGQTREMEGRMGAFCAEFGAGDD